jgi:hypothetical protein
MDWNKKYFKIFTLKSAIGALLGAIGGLIYYMLVGCSSGTCAIKSNPYLMLVWGALLGYLVGDMFNKKEIKAPSDEHGNQSL